MKNKLFIFFVAVVCFSSCQEIPPVVGGSDDDIVIVDDQQKNVLIEEYTGVQCVNCPEGAAIVSGLKAQHGKRH